MCNKKWRFCRFNSEYLNAESDDMTSGHGTWIGGLVRCDVCTHEWAAVYWSRTEKLECPHCGMMVTYELIEQTK